MNKNILRKIYLQLKNCLDNNGYVIMGVKQFLDCLNKINGTNFKLKLVGFSEMKDAIDKGPKSEIVLMKSLESDIEYNNQMVQEFYKNAQNTPNSFDSVTFPIMLLGTLFHEYTHCIQYEEYRSNKMKFQAFLNAMSYASLYFTNIPYIERSYEGEAYGNGYKVLEKMVSLNCLGEDDDQKELERRLESKNSLTRNFYDNYLVYLYDRMPYYKKNDKYVNLVSTFYEGLLSNSHDFIRLCLKKFLILNLNVLEENGSFREKTCCELYEQYLDCRKSLKGKSKKEKDSFIHELEYIYTYLFLGKFDEESYNNLCLLHDRDEIDGFVLRLVAKARLLDNIYNNSCLQATTFYEFWGPDFFDNFKETTPTLDDFNQKKKQAHSDISILINKSMSIIDGNRNKYSQVVFVNSNKQ